MITTIVRTGEAARTVVGENTAYALAARQDAEAARDATVTARDVVLAAIDVDYPSLAAATSGAANGAFFTYRDASGNPVYATKTAGVVAELPGPWFSSAKVGFLHSSGMVETDLAEVARRFGKVSVLNWIPVEYWAEIQSYTNVTYTTDHALQSYIQAAINWCQLHRCVLFFPRGYYRITDSLTVYGTEDLGATIIEGDSEFTSIIDMANEAADVFINGVPAPEGPVVDPGQNFRNFTLRYLTVRNGRWAVKISRSGDEVASLLNFRSVRFEFQNTGAIWIEQYLISPLFEDVVFFYCESALYCGRNANNVMFMRPRCEGLDGDIFELDSPGGDVNGCEGFFLISPRIEARNTPTVTGKYVFKGYRLSKLLVENGYVEDSHRDFLNETGSVDGVAIRNTHFTGAEAGTTPVGFKTDRFTSDGWVTLDGNRFVTGSDGAVRQVSPSDNRGLSRARGRYRYRGASFLWESKQLTLTDGTDVVVGRLLRPDPAEPDEPAGGSNSRVMAGTALVAGQVKTSTGRALFNTSVPFVAKAYATENVGAGEGTELELTDDSGAVIATIDIKFINATQTSLDLALNINSNGTFEAGTATVTVTGVRERYLAETHLEMVDA